MVELSGKDFVARERITAANGDVLVVAGETCERVPAQSLAWLLEGGHITLAPAAEPPRPRRARPAEDA